MGHVASKREYTVDWEQWNAIQSHEQWNVLANAGLIFQKPTSGLNEEGSKAMMEVLEER